MLDIKFIRENKEHIELAAKRKHVDVDIVRLLEVDDARRATLASIDTKRAEQNQTNNAVASAPTPEARAEIIARMKTLKDALQREEESLKEIIKEWQGLMLKVPNIPDMSVPDGESDAQNREHHRWGDIPTFDFAPKSHIELCESNDLADFERGAKLAGFRGYVLKGAAAQISMALWQFVMEHMTKKGYTPLIVPSLVRRELLLGTGYLPQGEEDLYKTQDAEYLAGTGEVSAMGYFMDEILPKAALPKKFVAFSPCFRREAGSHSKDTKGLIRVHEFFKLEQIILCEADHNQSVAFHEELLANAEEIMQALKLPYHVVVNCTGDLGLGQVKKYDIEAWMPSQNAYRETHSCSYFHDFQTRRLNIRYKDEEGKIRFAHSLNNTAIATPRIIAQILENNQRADGSINVPEVLRTYVGADTIESKK